MHQTLEKISNYGLLSEETLKNIQAAYELRPNKSASMDKFLNDMADWFLFEMSPKEK